MICVGRQALLFIFLLALAAASGAQTGTTGNGTETNTEGGEGRSTDVRADRRPGDDVGGSWAATLLAGRMTDASMVNVFFFNFGWDQARLYSGEVAYTLKKDNPFQKFMSPVLNNIDVVLNVTYQDDPSGSIWEINPFVMARWNKFPWNDTIRTTFGLGGGLSYASNIPSIEIDSTDPDGDYHNLLHYIAVEATFALPSHKDWQLVYRLHHRSGVFGLMGAENEGNTAVEFGLRHYFD